jgi:hypothetical protein
MLIVGVILVVAGVALLFGSRSKARGAEELRGVQRRQAGELSELVGEIAEELGQGAFRERVEIVGAVECEAPLTSPLGERPCLHYDAVVRREYEETYWTRDSQGNKQRQTRRSSEVVSQQRESAPFRVRDATGALLVQPDGARFDGLVGSVSRFEPGEPGKGGFGGVLVSALTSLAEGRRTLGYKLEEQVFPLDRSVTVIGQVSDAMGEVAVSRGGGPLIVSTRTREELLKGARATARLLLVLGLVALGGGLALVVAGAV